MDNRTTSPEPSSTPLAESNFWPNGVPRHATLEPLRLRRVPLLAAAICFAVGICLARPSSHFRPTITLLAATLSLLALTVLSLRRAPHRALLPVLALWILAGFWSAELEPAPPSQVTLEPFADGLSRTVEGHIVRIRELPPHATAARDPGPDSDLNSD